MLAELGAGAREKNRGIVYCNVDAGSRKYAYYFPHDNQFAVWIYEAIRKHGGESMITADKWRRFATIQDFVVYWLYANFLFLLR